MKQLLIFDEKQYSYISIEKCLENKSVSLKRLKTSHELDDLNDKNKTLIYIIYDYENLYEAILRMNKSRNFIFASHSQHILKQFSNTQMIKYIDLNKSENIKEIINL
jgi:hypothetical protein